MIEINCNQYTLTGLCLNQTLSWSFSVDKEIENKYIDNQFQDSINSVLFWIYFIVIIIICLKNYFIFLNNKIKWIN